MKRLKILYIFLSAVILHTTCMGQIKSMGFTQKAPNLLSSMGKVYYPKLQIMNDTLFVNSITGIYQKDMLKDGEWKLYAFKDAPVIEFVRNGNSLLASAISTTTGRDSLLLISYDNGKSYEDFTSIDFLEYEKNHLFRISQNPQNLNSILILAVYYGLYQSKDFGKKWQSLHPYSLGLDVAFTSFHPLDTTTIYYCGEGAIHNGVIYKTCNSGNAWTEYIVPGGDNCVHQIDFHPLDSNILIWGGEGNIGKSTDKGETWNIVDLYYTGMYFYKVLFDKDNPNILYASGVPGRYPPDKQDSIWVYRSIDTGDTWHLAYQEYLGTNGGGVIDMVKYKDKLIFYTRELGVLELDVKTTPVIPNSINVVTKHELSVYPNPAVNTIYFDTDLLISGIDIINSIGSTVQKDVIPKNGKSIDVSRLNEGIYLAVFHVDNRKITKKICIGQ